VWVYAVEIVPPVPKRRLDTIQALLDHEHAVARTAARTWAGRLVLERRVTHILIVSDSPGQERVVNHALESELSRLQATYTLTEPMEITAGRAPACRQRDAPGEEGPMTELVPRHGRPRRCGATN
jgi:hypothetical protein